MKYALTLSLLINLLFVALYLLQPPHSNVSLVKNSANLGYIGSEISSNSGGAAYYPKAQSFVAPTDTVSHVSINMSGNCESPWRVRLLSALPKNGGRRGLVDQMDLNDKTLGYSQVQTSQTGWVDFYFSPAVRVRQGNELFLFVDSSELGVLGPEAQWTASKPSEQPGPYLEGEGWVFVYSWSNNSNYKETFEKHTDYAFRVYQ